MTAEHSRTRNSHSRTRERGGFNLARSGMVTAAILVTGVLLFTAYWQAHRRAAFHKLRTRETPSAAVVPTPGGQEAVTLSRLSLQSETVPEFVSAVLVPGVGMQLQQLSASLPGGEPYAVLLAPSLADAAAQPSTLQSSPMHLFVAATPLATPMQKEAVDLIGVSPSTGIETETLPDGGRATAQFPATPGQKAEVSALVSTVLNGHVLDVTVAAKNNTATNRFVAFSWAPRFLISLPNPGDLILTLPSRQVWKNGGQSVAAADLDFATPAGHSIGQRPIDMTLVDLHTEFLADGPAVRMFDMRNGTLLRVTMFNPGVRSLHVRSDVAGHFLMLEFSSLEPSPDGNHSGDTLHAGQTLQWHMRVEVLPAARSGKPAATGNSSGDSLPVVD